MWIRRRIFFFFFIRISVVLDKSSFLLFPQTCAHRVLLGSFRFPMWKVSNIWITTESLRFNITNGIFSSCHRVCPLKFPPVWCRSKLLFHHCKCVVNYFCIIASTRDVYHQSWVFFFIPPSLLTFVGAALPDPRDPRRDSVHDFSSWTHKQKRPGVSVVQDVLFRSRGSRCSRRNV